MAKTVSFKRLILRAVLRQVSPMVICLVSFSDHMPLREFHDVFRIILGWNGMWEWDVRVLDILAADYSHELQGRGVKLYAHTSNNCFRINQQPIPCRLREAAFALDGLLEHDTELDPR